MGWGRPAILLSLASDNKHKATLSLRFALMSQTRYYGDNAYIHRDSSSLNLAQEGIPRGELGAGAGEQVPAWPEQFPLIPHGATVPDSCFIH